MRSSLYCSHAYENTTKVPIDIEFNPTPRTEAEVLEDGPRGFPYYQYQVCGLCGERRRLKMPEGSVA